MATTRCTFCQHDNPEDAQFCNSCGSSLKLQLCADCGAINDVAATDCHKCGKPLPLAATHSASEASAEPAQVRADEETASLPPARSAPQPGARAVLIGLAVLTALVGAAYLALRPADEPTPPPAAAAAAQAPPAVARVPESRDTVVEPPPQPIVEPPPQPIVEPPPQPVVEPVVEATANEAPVATEESPAPDPAIAAVLPAAAPPSSTTGCEPALDALGLCDHPQR